MSVMEVIIVFVLIIAGAFLCLKFRIRFEEAGMEARLSDQIAGSEARQPSAEARQA
jgi:protein-S-isoprenylcysteine O-methyltransferase Ste14